MAAWRRMSLGAVAVALTAALFAPQVATADAGAAISGTVTEDGTGRPLADVCVTALDENTMATGASSPSGPDGRYAITGLPQGAYQIAFRDCGPVPMHRAEAHRDRPLDLWSPTADVVWVPADATVTVDASLELGGAIIADVRWAHTGAPATVCVGSRPADSSEYVIREPGWVSCPDGLAPGSAALGGLMVGQHLLDLFTPDRTTHFGWYGGPSHDTATPVSVAAGAHTEIAVFVGPRPSLPMFGWGAPSASLRFDDVDDGSVHAQAIAALAHLDVMAGTASHTFGPSRPMTRGQAASTLVRALAHTGEQLEAAGDAFDDDDGSVHEPALDALAAAGIVQGSQPRIAAPNAPLTRAQAAALVTRIYEYRTATALRSSSDHFVDDGTSPLEPQINRAATAGLVQGTEIATFAPASTMVRAQAATTVARLLALLESDLERGAS